MKKEKEGRKLNLPSRSLVKKMENENEKCQYIIKKEERARRRTELDLRSD